MRNKKLALMLLLLASHVMPELSRADNLNSTLVQPEQKRRISQIEFEANQQISRAELEQLASPWLNQLCGQEELEDLRLRITRHYVQRGYINSGALLVPASAEDIQAGRQRLRLVEGRITTIQIKGLGDLRSSYIQQRLPALDSVLHLPSLQADYQNLLQDPLFSRLQTRILPGQQAGSAILDLEIERAPSYGLQLTFDNFRAPAVGEAGITMSGWKRNLSGYGDILEASLGLSQGAHPVSLSWSLPINRQGSFVRVRLDQGDTRIVSENLKEIDIQSKSSGWELAYVHKLPLTASWQNELGLSWGQRKNQNSLLGMPFSFSPGETDGYAQIQRLQVFHDTRWFAAAHAWALHNTLIFGRTHGNAESKAESAEAGLPASTYKIWQGQLEYLWQVDQQRQFSAGLQWQWSPDRLLGLERYALGGYRSIPGYRENSVVADKGWQIHGRWQQALANPAWQWYLSGQAGYAQNQQQAGQKLASLAAGWKWQSGRWQADLMYARRLTELATVNPGRYWQDHGIHLSLSYRVY